MLDDDSRVIRDGDELVPVRSWQSALRQLADTLAPGADIEIDPSSPEVSCARIAEAVQHVTDRRQQDIANHLCDLADEEEAPLCSRYPAASNDAGRALRRAARWIVGGS